MLLSLLLVTCSVNGDIITTQLPKVPRKTFNKDVLQAQEYDKLTSPYEISGQVQSFYITPSFLILAGVEESKQLVTYIAEINISWHDPRLVWDPAVMNFTDVVVRSELIWIPPVNTFNAAELIFLDTVFTSFDAQVDHTGIANYVLKAKIDTICIMDVVNFPFDVQYCNIDFDAGISTNKFAVVYKGNSSSTIYGLPEWGIAQPTVHSVLFPASSDSYFPCTIVTFKLTRNPQFYIYFLILPTITMTFCCMAALLLPLEIGEGERVNLGIAGLLGLTFMLSIIVVQVPRRKWLLVQMFFCIGAMLWEAPASKLVHFIEKRTFPAAHKQRHIFLLVHICSSVLLLGSNLLATILMFTIISEPAPPDPDELL